MTLDFKSLQNCNPLIS